MAVALLLCECDASQMQITGCRYDGLLGRRRSIPSVVNCQKILSPTVLTDKYSMNDETYVRNAYGPMGLSSVYVASCRNARTGSEFHVAIDTKEGGKQNRALYEFLQIGNVQNIHNFVPNVCFAFDPIHDPPPKPQVAHSLPVQRVEAPIERVEVREVELGESELTGDSFIASDQQDANADSPSGCFHEATENETGRINLCLLGTRETKGTVEYIYDGPSVDKCQMVIRDTRFSVADLVKVVTGAHKAPKAVACLEASALFPHYAVNGIDPQVLFDGSRYRLVCGEDQYMQDLNVGIMKDLIWEKSFFDFSSSPSVQNSPTGIDYRFDMELAQRACANLSNKKLQEIRDSIFQAKVRH